MLSIYLGQLEKSKTGLQAISFSQITWASQKQWGMLEEALCLFIGG